MTSGERRFSERLEKLLEDDYLCWYNVPVGPRQRQPDFLILHPLRGLIIIEVKDWNLETLRKADRESVTLLTNIGQKVTRNPIAQARGYAMEVASLLEKDPELRSPDGSEFAGRLCMPFGWGVVLSNITRAQFDCAGLGNAMEGSRVICKDEMTESASPEALQQKLWDCLKISFPCRLTQAQIDRIRWHLFPEIRLPEARQNSLFSPPDHCADAGDVIPDLIRIMDREQERLARSLGDGHRIIHGVAGSGKTMILGYRSVHLARSLDKPITAIRMKYLTSHGALLEIYWKARTPTTMASQSFHQPVPAGMAHPPS